MELNTHCKGCFAPWRLIGAEWPNEKDPMVKQCPNCDPVCLATGLLNAPQTIVKAVKAIGDGVKNVSMAMRENIAAVTQLGKGFIDLESAMEPFDIGVDPGAPGSDKTVKVIVKDGEVHFPPTLEIKVNP